MQESHFDEIRPFLTGETLDTSLSFPITHVDVKTPTDRITFLSSLLENKTVLHIQRRSSGCNRCKDCSR